LDAENAENAERGKAGGRRQEAIRLNTKDTKATKVKSGGGRG
jgi:hypothetical protein